MEKSMHLALDPGQSGAGWAKNSSSPSALATPFATSSPSRQKLVTAYREQRCYCSYLGPSSRSATSSSSWEEEIESRSKKSCSGSPEISSHRISSDKGSPKFSGTEVKRHRVPHPSTVESGTDLINAVEIVHSTAAPVLMAPGPMVSMPMASASAYLVPVTDISAVATIDPAGLLSNQGSSCLTYPSCSNLQFGT